jgi:hypothetical protein
MADAEGETRERLDAADGGRQSRATRPKLPAD